MLLRFFEALCGIAGASMAAKKCGLEVAGAFDVDGKVEEFYLAHFPRAKFFVEDPRNLDVARCVKEVKPVDVLYINAHLIKMQVPTKRKGRETWERDIVMSLLNLVAALRPRAVILEASKGMVKWPYKQELLEFLRKRGYYFRYRVLNSAVFKVPQFCKRWCLVARADKPVSPLKPRWSVPVPFRSVMQTDAEVRPLRMERYGKLLRYKIELGIEKFGPESTFIVSRRDNVNHCQLLDLPISKFSTMQEHIIVNAKDKWVRSLTKSEMLAVMGIPSEYIIPFNRYNLMTFANRSAIPNMAQWLIQQAIS